MLKTLTITGFDEFTPISEMMKLSHQYPFVEWGVLFSFNRSGNRYPEVEPIRELFTSVEGSRIRLAAHLCGGALRAVLRRELDSRSNDYHGLLQAFLRLTNVGRHQLNFNNFDYKYSVHDILEYAEYNSTKQVILQDNPNNRAFLESLMKNPSFANIGLLADASGGNGKQIYLSSDMDFVDGIPYGFAGGLGPNNIDETLKFLYANRSGPFWVDMESSVRTDDKLDLDKVRTVLEIANHYWES